MTVDIGSLYFNAATGECGSPSGRNSVFQDHSTSTCGICAEDCFGQAPILHFDLL